jgi:hypothetical protein
MNTNLPALSVERVNERFADSEPPIRLYWHTSGTTVRIDLTVAGRSLAAGCELQP